MELSSHLDWLQITFPAGFDKQSLFRYTGAWKPLEYGMLGYKEGFKSENGVRCYSAGTEKMGVHVIAGGEALELIRAPGVTDRELCQFASKHGGRASRLDMTINVFNSSLIVGDVVNAWKHGELHTLARVGTEDRGVLDPGHTLYIGGRSSERRARVYDKYAEVAIKDPAAFEALKGQIDSWLRFELQSRNDRARCYQGALCDNPTPDVIKQGMRDFIFWDDQVYLKATSGPDVAIPDLPRKPPAFWTWMADQCIPAAVKYQLDNPTENVMFVLKMLFEQRQEHELQKRWLI